MNILPASAFTPAERDRSIEAITASLQQTDYIDKANFFHDEIVDPRKPPEQAA